MLENIKALCKKRGLTIAQLEDRAGLSQNSIYRWDGSKPSVDKVQRVASVLNVSIDELLREDTQGGG